MKTQPKAIYVIADEVISENNIMMALERKFKRETISSRKRSDMI